MMVHCSFHWIGIVSGRSDRLVLRSLLSHDSLAIEGICARMKREKYAVKAIFSA
jgi:hypothetical protein